jgi:hypothetical protein
MGNTIFIFFLRTADYIKDCQSILEEVVSADRTKNNNNKMEKLSN